MTCRQWQFISTKGEKYYTHPQKIVIQPWRGQHHVYAIFAVPNKYATDSVMQVTLPENDPDCGTIDYIDNSSIEGIDAQPGYYLVKGYLNTRIALWLIAQGKGDKLQQPSNWKLGYGTKLPKTSKRAGD